MPGGGWRAPIASPGSRRPGAGDRARGGYLVSVMLPLASSSGVAIISVVVISAALLLAWLLRSDAREEAAVQKTRERADGEA